MQTPIPQNLPPSALAKNLNTNPAALKVAVLVSGNGSNLQVLIDAMQAGELSINIVGVISNTDKAPAIERAKRANIDTAVLSHMTAATTSKPDSIGKRMGIKTFEHHANKQLAKWHPDLIVLAGFMRVLSDAFINSTYAPMINLHPSLLPKYKGLDTHQRVLQSQDSQHGCSVHIVTAELDGGQVLTQAVLNLSADDTAKTLTKRVQKLEHTLLPWTVLLIANGVLNLSKIATDSNGASSHYLPPLPYRLLCDD